MASFHYAFKVKDISSTRRFYIELLGCSEGRSTETWIDFDFFGNQLSAHISENIREPDYAGKVENVSVPIPHFGCLLGIGTFNTLAEKLRQAGVEFLIEPYKRYPGQTGEQWTMFVFDFSGNPIEFKAFTNADEVFK